MHRPLRLDDFDYTLPDELIARHPPAARRDSRLLVVGGAGYVLSGFVTYLWPDAAAVPELLVVPATIGEVWMLGYLLVRGAGRVTG